MLAVDICSLENRRQSDSYYPIRNYAISPEVEPTICRHNVAWSRVFRRTSSHSSRCLGARFVGSARCWWSWNRARVSLKFSYYWMELCEDLEEISQWKLLKIVMVIKFHGDEEEWRMLSEAERRRVTPSKVEISRMKPNETEWSWVKFIARKDAFKLTARLAVCLRNVLSFNVRLPRREFFKKIIRSWDCNLYSKRRNVSVVVLKIKVNNLKAKVFFFFLFLCFSFVYYH